MRVLALDIETSGLDPKKDKILEIGFVVKEIKNKIWAPKNLDQGSYFLWEKNYPDPMPPELYAIHKISSTLLKEAGVEIEDAFGRLFSISENFQVDCIVAHNGVAFDQPFILEQIAHYSILHEYFRNQVWVDTKMHIQYPADCKNNNLLYLAAYHGFLNPFPHDALSDVQTMMRIIQHYDFEKIYKRAKEPWVLVKADVKFEGRELARARGFQWNAAAKHWEKRLPESEIKLEEKEAPFKFIRL